MCAPTPLQVTLFWNLESGIWNLESGIWNLESGIWNPEFRILPYGYKYGAFGCSVASIVSALMIGTVSLANAPVLKRPTTRTH
jgi:hypothetical protein